MELLNPSFCSRIVNTDLSSTDLNRRVPRVGSSWNPHDVLLMRLIDSRTTDELKGGQPLIQQEPFFVAFA